MTERAELLREALKSIIAREAGRRLLARPALLRISKMCADGGWINHDPRRHFHLGCNVPQGRFKAELETLIGNDQGCTHPFVVAELACGYLPDRHKYSSEFDKLTALPTIRTADVRYMIESRGLFSKGIGLINAQLIASCITTHGTQIWTIDAPLGRVAESLGLQHPLVTLLSWCGEEYSNACGTWKLD